MLAYGDSIAHNYKQFLNERKFSAKNPRFFCDFFVKIYEFPKIRPPAGSTRGQGRLLFSLCVPRPHEGDGSDPAVGVGASTTRPNAHRNHYGYVWKKRTHGRGGVSPPGGEAPRPRSALVHLFCFLTPEGDGSDPTVGTGVPDGPPERPPQPPLCLSS